MVSEVLKIVFSSTRPMPAYFTRNGEREKSFCVNFPELTAIDEYEMAAEAWHGVYNYVKNLPEDRLNLILRSGEDIMLAAYISTKLHCTEYIPNLLNAIIGDALDVFKEQFNNLEEVYSNPEVIKYFEHCSNYGRHRAEINKG